MEFHLVETYPFPRDLVFTTVRDRLPEVAPFIPDIASVEVLERIEESPTRVRFRNLWTSNREIPRVARAVLPDRIRSWYDHALWDEETYTTEWRLELQVFAEAVEVGGVNRYEETDEGTRFELRGRFELDLARVPGIPRFLGRGRIQRAVEEFILALLQPNLRNFIVGVTRFLETQAP